MTDREKLIDLLCYIPGAEEIADFFLANGVTIPVHCKDCKHWNVHPINGKLSLGKCYKLSRVMADDWFCCFGERKDNENQS